MNILIADVYPTDSWRLVKDTAGGYGTGNNFGNTFFSRLLNKFVGSMISMPSMSSMYVYSILLKQNHLIEYKRITNFSKISFSKYDFVIVPSSIIAHESEISFIKQLEQQNVKCFVIGIFGNIQKKKYSLSNSMVVPGEPEKFFLVNNINKIDFNKLKEKSLPNLLIQNLDDLPFPSWDHYVKKYPLENNFLSNNSKIAVPIYATRGCPYSCFNYCTYPLQQGRKVRFRSVTNIIDEIKFWKKKLNTNKFVFRDPVFSINRKFTVKLCEKIIKEDLKIEFLIETHLKNLDDELIEHLQKAGLKLVYVGIESKDENVLKNIKRFSINNDEQLRVIKKLKEFNITTKSMFMLGNPLDNQKTLKDTISYALQLPHELVQFSIFTPYPGTPIYKEYENLINTDRFEKFNQYNLVFNHKNLSDNQLREFKILAYKKFYLRPEKILSLFKYFLALFVK